MFALLQASGSGLVLPGSAFVARGAPGQAALTARFASPLMNEAEAMAEMPAQLAAWGCDAELWQGLRASGRANLKKQAKKGDEEGARARIEALKLLVKEAPKKDVPAPVERTLPLWSASAAQAADWPRLIGARGRPGAHSRAERSQLPACFRHRCQRQTPPSQQRATRWLASCHPALTRRRPRR
jgi:hypothetical protein